ncbi:Opioid growth factor receptor-like protein 1 [Mactra antiquata]
MGKNGKAKRTKSKRFSFSKLFGCTKVNSDSDESIDESTPTKTQSGICDQIDTEKRPQDKVDSNESPEHIPTQAQESRIPQVSTKPLYSEEKERLHVKHDYGCENIVERLPKCKDKYVKDPNRKPNAEKDLKDAIENGNSDDYPDFPYIDSETSDDGQHISHDVITTEHSRQNTNEIDICNEGKDAAQILVDVVLESNGVSESYHSYKSEDSTKPAGVPLKQDIDFHMPTEDTYKIEKHVTDENCHIKGNAALSHSNNIDDITDQSIECRTLDSIVDVNASLKESDQIDADEESMNEHGNMTDITKKSPTEEQEKVQREFFEVHNNLMIEKNKTQDETDTSSNDSSWPNDANYSGKSIESLKNKLQNKRSEHESSTQKEYETGNVVDDNGLEISIQASNDNDFNFETDAEKTHSSYSKASENVSFEIHNRMTETPNIEEINKQNDHEKENQMSQDNKSDTNSDQNDAGKVNMHEHIDTTDITEKSPTEKLEEFSEIHIHQMNEPNTSKTQDEDVGGEETDTSTNDSGSSNDANYSVNISVAEEKNKSHQQGLQSYSPVAESSIEGTYKMSNLSKENEVPQDHTPETNSVTVTTLSDRTTLNDPENTEPIHTASSEDKTKITEGAESAPNGSGHYDVSKILASRDLEELDTEAVVTTEILPPFSDNIRFYQNEIHSRPAVGYKIEDMLQWFGDYEKLERNHTYIQWLFPITESSGMNYQAQRLYDHEAEYIKTHEELKNRVFQSFEMMLDFYGMAIVNGEFCRNETNWEARYTHLNESFHNRMRITRIIRCLGEVGYEKLQTKWLSFIMKEAMVSKKLYKLGGNSMEYFIDAIKEDTDREKVYEKYFKYMTGDFSESDEEKDTSQTDNGGETNENIEEVKHVQNDHEINSDESDLGNQGCINTANDVRSNDTVDEESLNKKTNTLNVNNDLVGDEFVAEIEGNGFQNHMHEKSNSNKLLREEANINTTGNEEYQDDYEGSTESRDPLKAGLENFANADYGVDHADEKGNGMKNMTVVDNNSDENKVNAEINERDNNGLYHPAHDEQPNDKVEEEKLNRNTNMTKENGSSQYELDSHDNPGKYEGNARISEDDNSNLESIADDEYSSNRDIKENNENDLKILANDGQVNDEETLNKKTNSTERNAHLDNDECNNYTGESGDDTLGNVVEDKQNIYDIQPFGKTNVNTEGEQGNQGNHDKTNLDYTTNGVQSWDKDCEEKIFNETNMTDEHDSENETESTTKTGESSNSCFDSYNNSKQSGDGENGCETKIANVDDDGRSQEHRYCNTETYDTGKHSIKSPASDEPLVDYGDDHDDEKLNEMKDMVEDNTKISASDNIGPVNTANGEQSNDNFNDEKFNSNTNIAIEMDNRYEFNSYGDVSDDNGKVNFAIDEQFEYEEKLKVMTTTKKEHADPIDQTDNAYLSERENTNSGHTDIGGQNNDGDDKHTAETTNEVTNGDGGDADEHKTYSNNEGASDDDDYSTAEEDNIGMYEKMSNIANNYISNSDQEVTGPEDIGDCENIDSKGISSKEHYQSVTSVSEIDNISGNNIYKSGENISKGSDSGPEDIGDCANIDAKGISSKEHYQSVTSVSETDNVSGNNIYKSGENISKDSESDRCNTNNMSPVVTIASDNTEAHVDE